MALIKCPECGKDVSDKAKSCPNCGCPIESSSGKVKIMIPTLKRSRVSPKQKVTVFRSISHNKEILWEGIAGDVAEIYFDRPAYIIIKYHSNLMAGGNECAGSIDPSKSDRYTIFEREGFSSTELVLKPC